MLNIRYCRCSFIHFRSFGLVYAFTYLAPLLNLQETEPKLSPSWNPKIICEPHPQFTEPVCASTSFGPVQVGCLSGRLELSLVLKQNEAMPGAKVWNPTVILNPNLFALSNIYWF